MRGSILTLSLFLFSWQVLWLSRVDGQLTCGGGKIQIIETETDGKIGSVRWVNGTEKTIFVLTTNNVLYKSADEGNTWENQIPFMDMADVKQAGGFSGVWRIVSSTDNSVIYFVGFNGLLWVTIDNGATYQLTSQSLILNRVLPHPTNPAYALGDARSAGCADNTKGDCYSILYVTSDYGANWNAINSYINTYSWGPAHLPDIVWALEWSDKTGPQRAKSRYEMELTRTPLSGAKGSTPIDNVVYFYIRKDTVYVHQWQPEGDLMFYVSQDDGASFLPAEFPFGDFLAENFFDLLDDTEGSIFMSVRHDSFNWAHIYSSNKFGSEFDLSLEYASRSHGVTEFMKVSGLQGSYIANQVQDVEATGGTGTGINTLVSLSKGSEWERIPIPTDPRTGQQVPCADNINCQLNLHLNSKSVIRDNTFYGPVYSSKHAVGIVLATGNVGQYLDDVDHSRVQTYVSRDGGYNWFVALNGTYTYEFAAHGSVILFGDLSQTVNSLLYSYDDGATTTSCKITNNYPVEITDIRADPSGATQRFIAYGNRKYPDGTIKGVIFTIDFTGAIRQCTYPDDYEEFQPVDSHNSDGLVCMLGQYITYMRRKQNAICFNLMDEEIQSTPKICPCREEDYECDVCFEKIGGVCSKVADCVINTIPPTPCNGYYNLTSGYRLVSGDVCDPLRGLNLMPTQIACPPPSNDNTQGGHHNPSTHGTSAGIVVLIVFLVIALVVVVVGVFVYLRKRGVKLPFFTKSDHQPFVDHDHFNTALDDDLLVQKDPEQLEDSDIQATMNKNEENTKSLI